MAHDIRNTGSKSRATARTKIDENLDEIGDYLRDLVHEAAGTDELRLQTETDRILAAFKAGLAQPGARITVTVLDPSNNGTGLAAPHMLSGAPAPLVLGSGSGSNPAPLAPAPTASIDEELGRKLRALTSEPDLALDIVESVMRLGVNDASDVVNCISAFQPARGVQYTDLITFTAELAQRIKDGKDVINTINSGTGTKKVLKSIMDADAATGIVERDLNTVVRAVFNGSAPTFPNSRERVNQTVALIGTLRQEINDFESGVALHTGESRGGDDIQVYLQRALAGRRAPAPLPLFGAMIDLATVGTAIGLTRTTLETDRDFEDRVIAHLKTLHAAHRALIDLAKLNDVYRADGTDFDLSDDPRVVLNALIDHQSGGRMGMGPRIRRV